MYYVTCHHGGCDFTLNQVIFKGQCILSYDNFENVTFLAKLIDLTN